LCVDNVDCGGRQQEYDRYRHESLVGPHDWWDSDPATGADRVRDGGMVVKSGSRRASLVR
jgi:hypothetical protein